MLFPAYRKCKVFLYPAVPFQGSGEFMRTNQTRKRLAEGGVALGSSISHLRSPELPRMFSAAGLDWIFIDSEHGCFTIETIQDLVRSSLMLPITPVVRVADFQYDLVARALDMGAEGLILPRVESAEVLAKAITWAKFPPEGVRGFGLTPPTVGYSSASFKEITTHLNRETLLIAQVESVAALDRLDELAAVEGLDSLLVGPADLSTSLGIPGEWDNPRLGAAIDRVIAACEKHQRWPAIQVRTTALARHWMSRGMKLIGCGNELALLWNTVKSLADDLKAARGN
jgi:2-dehydro-3-deoxyglucarate aldolase/4-hydroxy-2-oxoheptanedioate aldolase